MADHEHASLALATGAHVVPTLLHQRQDPAPLLDSRFRAAHVFDLDLVVGLSRIHIVASDAPVDEESSEEQHEVGDHDHQEVRKLGYRGGNDAGQGVHRFQRAQAEEDEVDREVDAKDDRQRADTSPEQSPVGFEGPFVGIVLRRHVFTEDQPALEEGENSADYKHRDDRVNEGPRDAKLESDQRESEGRGADENREDPEDDHGGVNSLYTLGFRTARNTTIARPTPISTSPGLEASGGGDREVPSPRRVGWGPLPKTADWAP